MDQIYRTSGGASDASSCAGGGCGSGPIAHLPDGDYHVQWGPVTLKLQILQQAPSLYWFHPPNCLIDQKHCMLDREVQQARYSTWDACLIPLI